MEITLPLAPTPAQMPMALSSARYKLGGGGVGGGKSTFLGMSAADLLISYPDNLGYAGRADLEDFKKTTLLEILAAIPRELLVQHNKTEKLIETRTVNPNHTSKLYYGEMKDPNSVLSLNLGFAIVDEAFEIPLQTFKNLGSRLRRKMPDGSFPPYYVLMASNPSPCWLMDYFPVTEDERQQWEAGKWQKPSQGRKGIHPDFGYFPFLARDNPFLPPEYVQGLEELYGDDPVLYSRFVLGLWDTTMAGLVYQLQPAHRWNPKADADSVSAHLFRPNVPVLLGVDPSNGAGHYAAIVCQLHGNRLFVVDEFKLKGGTDEDFDAWLRARPLNIADMVFDSAKQDTIKRFQMWGYPARQCGRKDITMQINAVKGLMKISPETNTAALLVDETRCPKLVQEFGLRSYRPANKQSPDVRVSEQPIKKHDHLLNALEYLVADKFPTVDLLAAKRRPATIQRARYFSGRVM